jgi:hypothetical protein
MKLGDSPSQIRIFLHEINLVARFCCFDGGGESAHAAPDHQNTLSYCVDHAYPPKLIENKLREPHEQIGRNLLERTRKTRQDCRLGELFSPCLIYKNVIPYNDKA